MLTSPSAVDPLLESLVLEEISTTSPEPLPTDTGSIVADLTKSPARGNDQTSDASKKEEPIYGDSVELSLQDAVASTLEGNLELQVADFDPQIASHRIVEEIWRFESTFQGTLNRRRTDAPPSAAPPLPSLLGAPPDQAVDRFVPEIVVPFTTGGQLTVRSQRSRFSLPGSPAPNIHDMAPTIRYEQRLLRGAGCDVNTAQIQLAMLSRDSTDAATKLTAIRVVAETERAYWLLMGVSKNLEIARQQVKFAETQVAASKRLAEAGVATKVDALRAESGLNARREVELRAERDLLIATRELKRVMQLPSLPVDSTVAIEPISQPNLVGLEFDRNALAEKALANRLEMVNLAIQAESQAVNLRVATNSLLPQLDFVFEGKLLGTGTTHGRAHRQAYQDDYNEWFAGLTFSVPLSGNQSARSVIRQSNLSLAKTDASKKRLTVSIIAQINDAVDRFEKNWQRIVIAQETVAVATKTYEGEIRLFELGQRTSDLVLAAAANLADAQLQLVQSVVDFQLSRIDIAIATGTVLGYAANGLANELSSDSGDETIATPEPITEDAPDPPSTLIEDAPPALPSVNGLRSTSPPAASTFAD